MKDEDFNRYCAEVMGYKIISHGEHGERFTYTDGVRYDPLTYLNQMAEVFDKLWQSESSVKWDYPFITRMRKKGIAQAMREFIESTNE